jgi:AAA domain-containing protein
VTRPGVVAALYPEAAQSIPTGRPDPELRREGFDLTLAWPDGVQMMLTAIRDGRDGVRGELAVWAEGRRLHWANFACASSQAREGLSRKLEKKAPGLLWDDRLEQAAWRFTQAARQGEPLVTLTGVPATSTRELIPRLLYEGEPTLIFGDGDTGKSLTSVAVAAAVHTDTALPWNLRSLRAVPAAILDWETSRDTVDARVGLVAAGLGIDPPAIAYKRMSRPLVDEAAPLAAEFARRHL